MTLIQTRSTLGLLSLALLVGGATAARSQDYASAVVSSSNLSSDPLRNDPSAALGQPTTLVEDPGTFDAPGEYHASLVYPPYYTAPDGSNALAGLGSTGQGTLTLKFDTPITHSDSHWFGDDFIVYGNSTFSGADAATGNYAVTPTTDMSDYVLDSYGIYQNGTPTVSVSDDNIHFVTLTLTQPFFPENPYQWAGISDKNPTGWGAENDFTKPVDPNLTADDFVGKSVAYADNTLYNGSAGGAAFSLAGSGLTSIQYIRFTGMGNIDGVARVSDAAPVPEAASTVSFGLLLLLGLGLVTAQRRKQRSV